MTFGDGAGKERWVSDDERDETASGEKAPACATCGTLATAGDRFCAECGAALTGRETEDGGGKTGDGGRETEDGSSSVTAVLRPPSSVPPSAARDTRAWIFGARPRTVIGAGILLLLLGAALLLIGQLDDTGTIVMLSICIAPLALLTIGIGIARAVASAVGRG